MPESTTPSKLKLLFRSLRHRNFRLFLLGQSISLIGTWMQMLAVGWLTWRLSHDPFLLGLVPFIGRLPTFFLAPFVGVLIDRVDRHRLVILSQVLSMAQALALAALMFAGWLDIGGIIALQLLLGFINTVDMPARQSFMIQLLDDRQDLNNAIALNSSIVNAARLVGPALAGILVHAFGEGVCFLINGLSYIAVIGGLLAIRVAPNPRAEAGTAVLHNLKEGFQYAFGFPPMRYILLLLAMVSLVGQSYVNLLPIFADKVLGGTSFTQGLLISVSGVGALISALRLAMRTSVRGLGRIVGMAPVVMGIGLIGLGLSRSLWFSLPAMAFIGVGMMSQMASSNTLLQTLTTDEKRGRVMSFYSMAFQGMVPLGALLSGGLAAWIGAPWTVMIGGTCCIAGGLAFSARLPRIREAVHPIYVSKGILPEVAAGLAAATEQPLAPESVQPAAPREDDHSSRTGLTDETLPETRI
ncbi:MAG: MFS transporter [Candidatus Hydrogenedentes bacterium]|nr:MFS transporter [Candidatus Hydrogenedentota bacterium]